jgi:hypothetical protein
MLYYTIELETFGEVSNLANNYWLFSAKIIKFNIHQNFNVIIECIPMAGSPYLIGQSFPL